MQTFKLDRKPSVTSVVNLKNELKKRAFDKKFVAHEIFYFTKKFKELKIANRWVAQDIA